METDYRPLDIEMLSAKDLANTNFLSKMNVYIVSSISSDRRSIERTPVDKKGGTNPRWKKFKMRFNIDESEARINQTKLMFQIISRRVLGDRTIGFVHVPVKALLDEDTLHETENNDGKPRMRGRSACYQVTTLSGKAEGTLCFLYTFGEKFKVPNNPDQGYQYGSTHNNHLPIAHYSYTSPKHQNVHGLSTSPQQGYTSEYSGANPIGVGQKKRRRCFGLCGLCLVFGWGASFLKVLFRPMWW